MFDLSKVASVYSGKTGRCMCGCSGKYSYASAHREWAGNKRGYPVKDDDVSDRSVKTIVNKLLKLGPPNSTDDSIFYANWGDRIYAVYLVEE